MKDEKNVNREVIERYCHIIGENRLVGRITDSGKTVYECMNKHNCEKSGGCRNSNFSDGEAPGQNSL